MSEKRMFNWKWGVLLLFAVIAAPVAYFVYTEPVAVGTRFMRARLTLTNDMQKKTVSLRGAPIIYFEGGPADGPGIVLVHGLQDHAGTWWDTAGDLLDEGYHVVALDLPGHGESGPRAGPLTSELLLEAVEKVSKTFDKPFVMVGNSLGGAVSIAFSLEHPERVRRLVLVNSAGMPYFPDRSTFVPETVGDIRDTMQRVMGPEALVPPDFVLEDIKDSIHEGATPRLWDSLKESGFLDERLPELQPPTHVIWGEEDRLLDISLGRAMAQAIPGASFDTIPNCGHSPQVLCPDLFDPLLLSKLSENR